MATDVWAASAARPAPRLGRTAWRYALREALGPTLAVLLVVTTVVMTEDLLGLSELWLGRGLGLDSVLTLAGLEAISAASRALPFALLLGCLIALGRLGADRELLALESLGLPALQLAKPFLALALLTTVAALGLSLWIAPRAHRGIDRLFERIVREAPWIQMQSGVAAEFGGWQLEARQVSARGDELSEVQLWIPRLGETVFAREGRLRATPEGGIELTLRRGATLLAGSEGPRRLAFESLVTRLPMSEEEPLRDEAERLEGLSLSELRQRAHLHDPAEGRPLAGLALQRRFSLPVATLLLGGLSVPLFLLRGGLSRSSGALLGLLLVAAYYALIELAEGLIVGGRLPLGPGSWLPNAVLAGLAAVAFAACRRPGRSATPARSAPGLRWLETLRERLEVRPAEASDRPRRLQVHRWPLARYVTGRFARLALLGFACLLTAYLIVDVVDRLSWFARFEVSGSQALRYYAVRLPVLASRVVPMALLVASALLVSWLAAEGELTGIRACGISAPRALLPVLLTAAALAPAHLLLIDVVVPRTQQLVEIMKRREITAELRRQRALSREAPIWYRSDSRVVEAWRVDEAAGRAQGLAIYELDVEGLPVGRSDAREARHIGRGIWRLHDARRVAFESGRAIDTAPRRFEELGTLRAEVDTRLMGIPELLRQIEEVEASGYDASPYRVAVHQRLSEALACLVLPAAALLLALRGPPFPGPARNLLTSGAIGVGYVLLVGAATALGSRGALPPAWAGWAPTLSVAGLAWVAGGSWRRRP